MSDEWPETVWCLSVEPEIPTVDGYLTTQFDDWVDRDTSPLTVTDSREYISKSEIRELVEEWRERYMAGDRQEHVAHFCADELEELVQQNERSGDSE